MLATRRKRRELTEVNVYLNSKPLQHQILRKHSRHKAELYRTYYFHNKQMYPVNTHISKISKTKLGT